MEGSVTTAIDEGLATITFFHPAHNSLPGYLLSELANQIRTAGSSADVNIILLKSAGDRTFCAGASFDELMSITNELDGKKFFLGFAHVINAIRTCPKVVIGRVQGKAIGGGVGIAAAVDYCFATSFSAIKLSELALGIGPFVVGPAIERKMGVSAFGQLAINATEWQTAPWANEKGLYHDVSENIELMDKHISDFIQKLSQSSSAALSSIKQTLWRGTEDWDNLLEQRAEISGRLVITQTAQHAIKSARIA